MTNEWVLWTGAGWLNVASFLYALGASVAIVTLRDTNPAKRPGTAILSGDRRLPSRRKQCDHVIATLTSSTSPSPTMKMSSPGSYCRGGIELCREFTLRFHRCRPLFLLDTAARLRYRGTSNFDKAMFASLWSVTLAQPVLVQCGSPRRRPGDGTARSRRDASHAGASGSPSAAAIPIATKFSLPSTSRRGAARSSMGCISS